MRIGYNKLKCPNRERMILRGFLRFRLQTGDVREAETLGGLEVSGK